MLKTFLMYFIAVAIGTFIYKMIERVGGNVWMARGVGAVITVIVALILYYLWIKKE